MENVWQKLSHDSIIENIQATLNIKLSNLLLRRNSYINRVYELEELTEKRRFIVKFYRPHRWTPEMINEEHGFLNELANNDVSVIPPLAFNNKTLFSLEDISYAIFPKKGGRAMDEFDKNQWEEIGRLLARIHIVGEKHKTSKRITWMPNIATKQHLEVLINSSFVLPDFKKSLKDIVDLFIGKANQKFNEKEFILLHGDCHKGNLLHRPGEGIYVVDFDDVCLGPAIQDVWMLFPDKIEKCENEWAWFLKGYNTFETFDQMSVELVDVLRGMRIIHFAAWLAIQQKDLDFNNHFPEAGTKRYWNELIKELQAITYQI